MPERTFYNKEAERREINSKMEAKEMTTVAVATFHAKGTQVLVEVHGLPKGTTDEPVFTYKAHAELRTGELVLVPAPEWSVRVTGRTELPGYVLGESHEPVPQSKLRSTMPLSRPESHPNGLLANGVTETQATWRRQAAALLKAYNALTEAAEALEQARR